MGVPEWVVTIVVTVGILLLCGGALLWCVYRRKPAGAVAARYEVFDDHDVEDVNNDEL